MKDKSNKAASSRSTTRPLRTSELGLYLDHLLRLNAKSRYKRFEHAMSDEALRAHCNALMERNCSVLGAFRGNLIRGAAELDPFCEGAYAGTEIAFSVEHRFQRMGIGSQLMRSALEHIKPARAVMFCLPKNDGMISLAKNFGASPGIKGAHLIFTLHAQELTENLPDASSQQVIAA